MDNGFTIQGRFSQKLESQMKIEIEANITVIKDKFNKIFHYNNWNDDKIAKKNKFHEKIKDKLEEALKDFNDLEYITTELGLTSRHAKKNLHAKALICLAPGYGIFYKCEEFEGKIWRRVPVRDQAAVLGISWMHAQKIQKWLEKEGYIIRKKIRPLQNKQRRVVGDKTKMMDNANYIILTAKGFSLLKKAQAIGKSHNKKDDDDNNENNKIYEHKRDRDLDDKLYNYKSSNDNFSYKKHNSSLCANLMRIYEEYTGDIGHRYSERAYAFLHQVSKWISTTDRIDLLIDRFRDFMKHSVNILGKTVSFYQRLSKKCIDAYLRAKEKAIMLAESYTFATDEDIKIFNENCINKPAPDPAYKAFYESPTQEPDKSEIAVQKSLSLEEKKLLVLSELMKVMNPQT